MAKREDDFMPTDPQGTGDRTASEGDDIILDGADDVRGIAADEEDDDDFDEDDEDLDESEDEEEEGL